MESDVKALKEVIASTVFVKNNQEEIANAKGPEAWIFDFRRILLNGSSANLIAEIFYKQFKDQYPFQLCALEVAGIPLLTSLVNKFYEKGHGDVNGFFIRKSRKKDGLMRMIEGTIAPEKNIILVDDTINSGSTFWRQIEVLEELGYRVQTVWSILRYRDEDFYTRFHNRNIVVKSLFTLNDLTDTLGPRVKNLHHDSTPPVMPFTAKWVFKSERPSYQWVVPKSQPLLHEGRLYFGADNRTFWALNCADGSVDWTFIVGAHSKRKAIFSNPACYRNLVIFGAYDGNVYGLDKHTGKQVWVNYEADWVGSSPAIAAELGLVFIGQEFGLVAKRGGIVALNAATGKHVWQHDHPAMTHSTPLYLENHRQVVIGSNDGKARLYQAETGEMVWESTTFGGASYDPFADGGFGAGDIKETFAYDQKRDLLIFGSIDGFLYILERVTGNIVYHYRCEFAIRSTPLIYKDRVYFTSLDKKLRCINLDNGTLMFEKTVDGTRIFSSPTIINGRLYVGTNAGRLHELDPETGTALGYFQALERITNEIVYERETGRYFLPTYANEIICLERDNTE